jgi:hypothetical protein
MGRLVSARKRTLTALGVGVIASAAALRLMPWHMARSWGGRGLGDLPCVGMDRSLEVGRRTDGGGVDARGCFPAGRPRPS